MEYENKSDIRVITWYKIGYETLSTGCKHCGNANSRSKNNIFSYLRTSAFFIDRKNWVREFPNLEQDGNSCQ